MRRITVLVIGLALSLSACMSEPSDDGYCHGYVDGFVDAATPFAGPPPDGWQNQAVAECLNEGIPA